MVENDLEKQADIISDRVVGITNDLKTFVDLRKDNRQHRQNLYNDNLGGGNMSMAVTLFAMLGLLGKVYVCVKSNEEGKFDNYFDDMQHGKEEKIFVELILFVNQGLSLFNVAKPSKTQIKQIWEYFRDFTTHLLVPGAGHRVMTIIWDSAQNKSVNDILRDIKCNGRIYCFERRDDNNWDINVDKILAITPEIVEKVTDYLKGHKRVCTKKCADVLGSVLWR